jgi:hypothetical protein
MENSVRITGTTESNNNQMAVVFADVAWGVASVRTCNELIQVLVPRNEMPVIGEQFNAEVFPSVPIMRRYAEVYTQPRPKEAATLAAR